MVRRVFWAAIAALALVLLLIGSGVPISSRASAASSCPTPPASFAPENASASQLAAYCYSANSPTSVEPLPGGGSATTFDVTGRANTFLVPPTGFQPADATSAQLAEYGFPPAPATSSSTHATWLGWMKAYKYTTKIRHLYSRPGLPTISNAPLTSDSANWGGYVADAASQVYTSASGNFTEPTITAACGPDDGWSGWYGIGGVNSGGLQQAGSGWDDPNVNLSNPTRDPNNPAGGQVWYEDLSPGNSIGTINTVPVPGFYVNPGDNLAVQIWVGAPYVYYFIEDTNSGQQVTVKDTPTQIDESSAEAVVERSYLSTQGGASGFMGLPRFTNFQQFAWTEVNSQYGVGMADAPLDFNEVMVNNTTSNYQPPQNTGNLLSQTTNEQANFYISGYPAEDEDQWTQNWYNCQ